MLINRCPKCEGRKRIIVLGAMIKDCPQCKGIGHIKKDEPAAENKSAGRPKKKVSE